MGAYIAALILGLIGIYKLREGLLIIQNARDEKLRQQKEQAEKEIEVKKAA